MTDKAIESETMNTAAEQLKSAREALRQDKMDREMACLQEIQAALKKYRCDLKTDRRSEDGITSTTIHFSNRVEAQE